jgi:hypothetical protein
MMHSDSATFINHYRPRRQGSIQEVILGLTPDQEWERALTSIDRWRDKRRPRHLDDSEKAFVERDSELQAAIRHHDDLIGESKQNPDPGLIRLVKESQQNVTNTRRRLRYKRKNEVRQELAGSRRLLTLRDSSLVPSCPTRTSLRHRKRTMTCLQSRSAL